MSGWSQALEDNRRRTIRQITLVTADSFKNGWLVFPPSEKILRNLRNLRMIVFADPRLAICVALIESNHGNFVPRVDARHPASSSAVYLSGLQIARN
jgi:hypothetical protein